MNPLAIGSKHHLTVQMFQGRHSFRPQTEVSSLVDPQQFVKLFFPKDIWYEGFPGEIWEVQVLESRFGARPDRLGRRTIVSVVQPIRRIETARFCSLDDNGTVVTLSQSGYSVKVVARQPARPQIVVFSDNRGGKYEFADYKVDGVTLYRQPISFVPAKIVLEQISANPTSSRSSNVVQFRS